MLEPNHLANLVLEIEQGLERLGPALREHRDELLRTAELVPAPPQLLADVAAVTDQLQTLLAAWRREA